MGNLIGMANNKSKSLLVISKWTWATKSYLFYKKGSSLLENFFFAGFANGLIIKFPINELEKAIEISQELIKNKNFNTLSVIDLRIKGKVITQSWVKILIL